MGRWPVWQTALVIVCFFAAAEFATAQDLQSRARTYSIEGVRLRMTLDEVRHKKGQGIGRAYLDKRGAAIGHNLRYRYRFDNCDASLFMEFVAEEGQMKVAVINLSGEACAMKAIKSFQDSLQAHFGPHQTITTGIHERTSAPQAIYKWMRPGEKRRSIVVLGVTEIPADSNRRNFFVSMEDSELFDKLPFLR